jgi:Arc/MetJ-type ribon-helix-helix transcriptional regulator
MKNTFKIIVATSIMATSAAPLFAQSVIGDPMTTSCGDFLSLGDSDRMLMALQYDAYSSMSEADKTAVEAMTEEEKAALIADTRMKREALSAEEQAKINEAGTATMEKIMVNCKATPEKVVVDAMDAAM